MQPNRYNTKQKKVTTAYITYMGGHTESWVYTILEENRSNLKANY